MPRPRGDATTPTSIRLPPALYKQLDEARDGKPLGEEIRRRLEASFAAEPVLPGGLSPYTKAFVDQIIKLLGIISSAWGDPGTDPGAHAVFRLAVKKIVDGEVGVLTAPEGEAVLKPRPGAPRDATIESAADSAAFASIIW